LENAFHRAQLAREHLALRASEARYRQIIETAREGIWVLDADSNTSFVNQMMAEMLGHAVEEMVGKPLFAFMDEKNIALAAANVERRRQGITERHEFEFMRKDGTTLWAFLSTNPLYDDQGQYAGALAMVTDISSLKKAQDTEREQRALAEALAETASALTRALDLEGVMNTILENVAHVVPHDAANIMLIEGDQAHVVYWRGYRPERISFLQELRIPLAETQHLQHMLATRLSFLAAHTDQDPGWVRQSHTEWVKSYVAAPIRSREKVIGFLNVDSGVSGFFTEDHAQRLQSFADQASFAIERAQLYEEIRRHAAELEQRVEERTAQLNHAKERIEAILNSSNDVMILCRTDSLIDQVNPAFDTTFGCTPEKVYNQPLATLVTSEHISLLEQTFEAVVQTLQPQRLEITARFQASAAFDGEMVLSPVVGVDRQLFGVICSLRDITERKKMEAQLRQMLEHEMELSELKSHYVSMAAHDLRNPLAAILTTVEVVEKYHDRLTEEQRQARYDSIHRSIKAMIELLNDILTIGQAESGKLKFEPGLLDLVTFSQDLATELQQATGGTQRIELSYQGACDAVYMDAKLLRHILGNLLSNALKYSPADNPVSLEIQCEANVVISRIQDRGIGIPHADQARLFEVFHRAGNVGSTPGTGLGLAIVKQSVDLHGGTISFESEEGVGTTFTVVIPQPASEDRREK
jgi:PAS domain S-box-containing protein